MCVLLMHIRVSGSFSFYSRDDAIGFVLFGISKERIVEQTCPASLPPVSLLVFSLFEMQRLALGGDEMVKYD